MRRTPTALLVLAIAVASLLSFLVCKKPQVGEPPTTPAAPSGITNGGYNTSYQFSATTTDPDTDSISIRFQWDDTATSDWSNWVASGETVSSSHAWPNAGTYQVKAQAKDRADLMSDWSAALAVSIVATRPPEPPYIQGPTKARPADTLSYRFTSTDPDGDSVFFMVSWGDGASTQWSPASASGEDYTQTHTYSDSGTFYIKAKAKDREDAESEWSDSLRVQVGSFPPEAPIRPTGPTRCSTGIAYTWSTRAAHPLHDSVSIQFFWSDTVGDWGPMVASNEFYEAVHIYSLPGTYKIAAKARDVSGLESPWSESLVVTVDTYVRDEVRTSGLKEMK